MKNIPPELDGSPASTELGQSDVPTRQRFQPSISRVKAKELIEELENVKAEIKILEEQKNECENKLKQLLGEHEAGRIET